MPTGPHLHSAEPRRDGSQALPSDIHSFSRQIRGKQPLIVRLHPDLPCEVSDDVPHKYADSLGAPSVTIFDRAALPQIMHSS